MDSNRLMTKTNIIFGGRLGMIKKGRILVVGDDVTEKEAALLRAMQDEVIILSPDQQVLKESAQEPAITDEEIRELIDALETARRQVQLVTAERNDLIQARDKLTADLDTTTRERDLCIEEIAGLQEDLAKLRAGILDLPPKIREKFDLGTAKASETPEGAAPPEGGNDENKA